MFFFLELRFFKDINFDVTSKKKKQTNSTGVYNILDLICPVFFIIKVVFSFHCLVFYLCLVLGKQNKNIKLIPTL